MGNFGIKIGDNIETDSDVDLQLTSKHSMWKAYKWGNTSFTTNGSGVGSVEITHGLGYAPISLVFRKATAQWASPDTILPTTQYSNSFAYLGALNWYFGGNESIDIRVKVDDNKLYIQDNGLGNLSPNTTYNFRYYILVDLSQAFSDASNVEFTGDYGFKVAKPGKSALESEEYDMEISSKYKALQFFQSHIQDQNLTLPEMFASRADPYVEEATYVDFEHNLGYAPLFLAYFSGDGGDSYASLPFYSENALDTFNYSVAGFADANKVRIYFWRASAQNSIVPVGYEHFNAQTINIKCIIFAENLAGEASP